MITPSENITPNFADLKKPTGAQFKQIFDSFGHRQRDFDQLGGGLKPHNPNRAYTAGEAAICLGKIRLAKTNLAAGAYNPTQWEDYDNNPVSLGIPRWLPDVEYEYDTENPGAAPQVIHQLSVLQATANSVGIEPFVDPDWEDYWEVLVTTRGGVLPVYIPGPVENGLVYEYTGSAAPKGIYRANHTEEPYQNGFKSTNFATELADEKWVLVALRNGGGGVSVDSGNDLSLGTDGLPFYQSPALQVMYFSKTFTRDEFWGSESVVNELVAGVEDYIIMPLQLIFVARSISENITLPSVSIRHYDGVSIGNFRDLANLVGGYFQTWLSGSFVDGEIPIPFVTNDYLAAPSIIGVGLPLCVISSGIPNFAIDPTDQYTIKGTYILIPQTV
jgi:hypothetical protein